MEEGCVEVHPIRDGYVLPHPKFLRHTLAQIHAAPMHGHQSEGHRTTDKHGA